VRNQPWTQ